MTAVPERRYRIEAAGLAGEFEIIKTARQSQINWWLIGGMTSILGVWLTMRRRPV